jgi:hypothetical protein
MKHTTIPTAMSALVAICATNVMAGPTLSLNTSNGNDPLVAGDTFEVTLRMSDLGANEAAGFMAFLQFDPDEVTFISGAYTSEPFGLPIIDPIVATDGFVALAAGVDAIGGQQPTSDDADLAALTFELISGPCVTSIGFADHEPPTTLTDAQGQPIEPLTLLDLPALPTARLSLRVDYGEIPVDPGDFIVITLSMTTCAQPAAGFQAFLEFDDTGLSFVHGSYVEQPFQLPVITPITADGPVVAVAAGIDVIGGELPFLGEADLVELTFESLGGGCVAPAVFAQTDPPSRLTDAVGDAIEPLVLDALPVIECAGDIVRDCIVNVDDLLLLLAEWGASDSVADINGDGAVDVNDLLLLLAAWGPCLEP